MKPGQADTYSSSPNEIPEFLRVLVAALDPPVILLSSNIIVGWSAGAQRLLGFMATDHCGQSISTVFPDITSTDKLTNASSTFVVARNSAGDAQTLSIKLTRLCTQPTMEWITIEAAQSASAADNTGQVAESSESIDWCRPFVDNDWNRKEMDRIGYALSHDLRAPLRAVRGFSEILARSSQSSLSEQDRHHLQNILDAGGQLELLLTDLVTYVRCGRNFGEMRKVSLDNLFQKLNHDLQSIWSSTGATLKLSPDFPVVLGDRKLLHQAFSQLLTNAATYHTANSSRSVTVDWHRNSDGVVIVVSDNATEIAPRHHEAAFQLFQRLIADDGSHHSGAGLAIARKAVEMQGGRIWLEANPVGGNVFFVSLREPTPQTDNNGQGK